MINEQLTKDVQALVRLLRSDEWLCNHIFNKQNRLVPFSEIERAYIMHVYDIEGGNMRAVASRTGIAPSTLYKRMAEYGIQRTGKHFKKVKRGAKQTA